MHRKYEPARNGNEVEASKARRLPRRAPFTASLANMPAIYLNLLDHFVGFYTKDALIGIQLQNEGNNVGALLGIEHDVRHGAMGRQQRHVKRDC